MLPILVLLAAAGSLPVERFARDHPASARVSIASGEQLVHASGFRVATGRLRPADAARAFLAEYGSSFGVTDRQELEVLGEPAQGQPGAVRLARTLDGLPVFGGDLVLGIDGEGRVFVINASAVPAAVSGTHALGEAKAIDSARASFGTRLRAEGPSSAVAGWRAVGDALRAVYRVDFIASDPAGDWRVFVDAETGRVVLRENLRFYASAPASVFEVSPVETLASLCPVTPQGGRSFCANPAPVTLQNLLDASSLAGTQTAVYNCMGTNAPTSPGMVPGVCANVSAVGGAFNFMSDSTYRSTSDDFAAVMAYYHLDRHVSFLKGLDPSLPPKGRAVRGSLPALVNAQQDGLPYENAYFSGALDAMVFGQGARADYAYDASIIYHELTHGAVFAWGGYGLDIDALGGLDEPSAIDEGTADALSVSEIHRSTIASFIGATADPPEPFMRDLADAHASRTCQGDGTSADTRYGFRAVNGLDGESHDDGQIWGSFFWEVAAGLADAGIKGCGGNCDAGAALQYKTIQLAGGTKPTFASYWLTFKAAASELFPGQPSVASYVECVARRRKLDQCDRTAGMYAGETRVQYVRLQYSPFQVVLHTSGDTEVDVCSTRGTSSTLHGRLGKAVALSPGPAGQPVITSDGSAKVAQKCSAGKTKIMLSGAGDWYLLVDSPDAMAGGSPGSDVYRYDAAIAGMQQRPFATAPEVCAPPSVLPLIWPRDAVVPPRGTLRLTATGGSGEGYTWSFATNASGGSLDASGLYTAGATAGVTDVVQVKDSAGGQGTRSIAVGPGIAISTSASSISPKGALAFTASGGSGTGFVWSLGTNGSGGEIDGASGAYQAGAKGSTTDVVQVVDSLGNVATRELSVTAGVSIAPGSVSLAPRGTQNFTASGGSGTGYQWSLVGNVSGASINALTGQYTAGSANGTDHVRVIDSLGNEADATVNVGSGGGGCGSAGLSAAPVLGLLALFLRRRKQGGRP